MAIKLVLVIDDEEEVCRVIKEGLERIGDFAVISANNGKDGLRMAKRSKPDLVLLDIDMPSMSGFRVLESLKEDSKTFPIPVVMLTAHSEAAYKTSAARLYSEDYITKPVSIVDLKVKIETILARFAI